MKATIQRTPRARVFVVGLAMVLAALVVALAGVADPAQAKKKNKNAGQIVFASDRTSGKGVNNLEGDFEIFVMNPDGKKPKQLTENAADDVGPTLSPDGQKIAYASSGVQSSNEEGDSEVYLMNADGSKQRNLTNTAGTIFDSQPDFSPDNQKIAYSSRGDEPSNPERDFEVYLMKADGSKQKNLSNTTAAIADFEPDFSPDGRKIAYSSSGGVESSNPDGDREVFVMNAPDGSNKRNLTNTKSGIADFDPDFSPDGQKIAYDSFGGQASNKEGDSDVYLMNALDGSDQENLTDNGGGIDDFFPDFSPDGQKIAYESSGVQSSNEEGDDEVYLMKADGSKQKNLTKTAIGADAFPDFGKAKKK